MPGRKELDDPMLSYRFAVEISGMQQAFFTECTGLEATTEVFEYKEGGSNASTHKLPGRTSFSNITLKWGTTLSDELTNWYGQLIAVGAAASLRKDVSIVLYDSTWKQVARWNLNKAFPMKWSGPTLNPSSNEVTIQSLEFAFDEIEFVSGGPGAG
jgi:phage tail-like protein